MKILAYSNLKQKITEDINNIITSIHNANINAPEKTFQSGAFSKVLLILNITINSKIISP